MILSETLQPVDMPVNQGFLNRIRPWVDSKGRKYLSRGQNDDQSEVIHNLQEEYAYNGFLKKGGAFRIRSPREQLQFVAKARKARLRVVPFVGVIDGDLVMPMIAGDDMKSHVNVVKNERALFHVIRPALRDIAHAHNPNKRLVYGDRWLKNILVGVRGGVHHVDFDIEISGPFAGEYEMAQFFYSMVRDAQNKDMLLAVLATCGIREKLRHHNTSSLVEFLGSYGLWYGHKHPDDPVQSTAIQKAIGEVQRMM